jgi:hypothetical protein
MAPQEQMETCDAAFQSTSRAKELCRQCCPLQQALGWYLTVVYNCLSLYILVACMIHHRASMSRNRLCAVSSCQQWMLSEFCRHFSATGASCRSDFVAVDWALPPQRFCNIALICVRKVLFFRDNPVNSCISLIFTSKQQPHRHTFAVLQQVPRAVNLPLISSHLDLGNPKPQHCKLEL